MPSPSNASATFVPISAPSRSPIPPAIRVLLQTDPLEFRLIAASVRSEQRFNQSPGISLTAPTHLAVLVPGDTPMLASVDRGGSLAVLRADPDWLPIGGSRSVAVPDPVHLSVTGDKLLVIGASRAAVVIDLSDDTLPPVAAGRVPYSDFGYRLLPDGVTVELTVAGRVWRVPLPALPDPSALARYAEAAAGSLKDSFDRDQVVLGERLTRGDAARDDMADLALGGEARCYLAANALLEAWRAEGGQGMASARLSAAREETQSKCAVDGPIAAIGQRLAAASHLVSPELDPWSAEWSAILADSLAGNRSGLARRSRRPPEQHRCFRGCRRRMVRGVAGCRRPRAARQRAAGGRRRRRRRSRPQRDRRGAAREL
jgi:hypothetical protein